MEITKETQHKAIAALRQCAKENENALLKEKVAAQQEWIERLMEFVNMPDEKRGAAVKEYVENRKMSEQFRELFSPYFDALNRLNILSL